MEVRRPVSLTVPRVARVYGALDTAAVASGDAAHAHVLHEIARSTNRLLQQGSLLCSFAWDSSTDTSPETNVTGSFQTFMRWDYWDLIIGPVVAPKKPHLTTYVAKVIAKIPNGENLYLQFGTHARPFDANTRVSMPNVLTCAGTGSFETYTLTGIPGGSSAIEHLTVHAQGDESTVLGATGTYGAPNTGTPTEIATFGMIDSGTPATWQLGPRWSDDGRHVVAIEDANNVRMLTREISYVVDATRLNWQPEISRRLAEELRGDMANLTYYIYARHSYRLAAIVVRTEEGDPRGV